mmetsp:Transcript_5877/g.14185  ORF Transcript_5877/g.14185 Transcript_5877/m.14185 type:complete len:88 (-) Transcript_5877:68-331(-)
MQYAAGKNCLLHGSHFYGSKNDGNYICHLDGSEHNYKAGTCGKELRDGNRRATKSIRDAWAIPCCVTVGWMTKLILLVCIIFEANPR